MGGLGKGYSCDCYLFIVFKGRYKLLLLLMKLSRQPSQHLYPMITHPLSSVIFFPDWLHATSSLFLYFLDQNLTKCDNEPKLKLKLMGGIIKQRKTERNKIGLWTE